jgi:hypothetical protein
MLPEVLDQPSSATRRVSLFVWVPQPHSVVLGLWMKGSHLAKAGTDQGSTLLTPRCRALRSAVTFENTQIHCKTFVRALCVSPFLRFCVSSLKCLATVGHFITQNHPFTTQIKTQTGWRCSADKSCSAPNNKFVQVCCPRVACA